MVKPVLIGFEGGTDAMVNPGVKNGGDEKVAIGKKYY